jgi:hypothetical protein
MGKFMPKQVNIWAPILKGDSDPMMSLAVPCGEKAPNREMYRLHLQDHLDSEILSNPNRSKEEMQAMGSTSEYPIPELSAIPVGCPPRQWAAQILQLDEMAMLLSQIDWQKDNPPRSLSDENLPSLMDILQML